MGQQHTKRMPFSQRDYNELNSHIDINSFTTISVIGRGTLGKVLLVRNKANSEFYAVKQVRKDTVNRLNQEHHIISEKRILERISHPFIVNLRYAFQTDKKLFFVFDYISGGELFFHLNKIFYFSEAQTKFYAAELVCAIQHLHSHHIIYRDLKPENVLLDSMGHIKLTDFGLAKDITTTKRAKSICGTAEYMPPEVLEGKFYDYKSDVWSLGVLIYEMLTGKVI